MKTLFSNDEDDDDDGEDDECDDEEEEEGGGSLQAFPVETASSCEFSTKRELGRVQLFIFFARPNSRKQVLSTGNACTKQANEEEEDGDDDHWWLLIQDILLFRTVGGYL